MQETLNYDSSINSTIEQFKINSFSPKWEKQISDVLENENIRINSLVIGQVAELPSRIYVGANTNKILIFDLDGVYLEYIELDEADEVIKLEISNIAGHPFSGNELIVQTSNDSILFYNIKNKGAYHKLQYEINYVKSTITCFFTISHNTDTNQIFIGDSKGEVLMTTYDDLKVGKEKKSIIPDSEKLPGEIVAAIAGSNTMLEGEFGLLIGYKNGVLLLFNNTYELVDKFDIDKEIEQVYLNPYTQNIVISTDDYYIFHFTIANNKINNNWHYLTGSEVSAVISDPRERSEVEFFLLSEDNGTISSFSNTGSLILLGDPSFEGTTGVFYNDNLILGSREGEICAFSILDHSKIIECRNLLYKYYSEAWRLKTESEFFEFINTEFESAERVSYFKEFLYYYLQSRTEAEFNSMFISLFQRKKYNTDIAEGMLSKIISDSKLKNCFLKVFDNTAISADILSFQTLIDTNKNATNLIKRAESALNKDPLKYIELMSEIRIQKLDKIWLTKIFEDDDVVALAYFHDPNNSECKHILVGTRKGKVMLLDKDNGQMIWNFKLDIGEGQITNIEVADICNNGMSEILIGLENAQNSILILSTDKDLFNAANNEVELIWNPTSTHNSEFRIYVSRCRVSGMEFNAIHKVHCFDFDFNGVHDLMISSENGRFEIFYFDNKKSDRIIPKNKTIEYDDDNDDDVLVFDLLRDGKGDVFLYTGTNSGNIEKHIYDGNKFVTANCSFTERDAKITDILLTTIEGENVVLFSSEDNYIYCLNNELEYIWSFRTGGDAKSISVSEYDGETLIFTISDDGVLYAIDTNGNKLWDYSFFCPLDKLLVKGNELTVADSDGTIHLLQLKDINEVIRKMDADLGHIDLDLNSLIDNQSKYIRIYAIRKLVTIDPSITNIKKIRGFLNDAVEFDETVRCEVIKLLTSYLENSEVNDLETCEALLASLKDNTKEVRLEALISLFKLIDKHEANGVDLRKILFDVAEDEDIWVKEYLAGALSKITHSSGGLAEIKWQVLLSLMVLNKDEEWILNEVTNTTVRYIFSISTLDFYIPILDQIFDNDFDKDTFDKIREKLIKVKNSASIEIHNQIANIFELYYQIKFGNPSKLRTAYAVYQKEFHSPLAQASVLTFNEKINLFLTYFDQININEIINEQLLFKLSNYLKVPNILDNISKNLASYQNENNISDKIVYLNYVSDAIKTESGTKKELNSIDKKLFEWSIEGHLNDLVSKTSKLLLDNVYLDVEMEKREIIMSDSGLADFNFDIINSGYKIIEDIEIIIRPDAQFEIVENIGEVGELVKSQRKRVYFKIKPRTTGPINIYIEVSYKGCARSILEQLKVVVIQNKQKPWSQIPNPYTSGIPIEDNDIFVGRESLIEEAVNALKKDPVFVMGHRRMGKTSLIKFLQRNYLSNDPYIPIFISAEKTVYTNTNEFLFSFCSPIANELGYLGIISEERADKYRDKIRENGLVDFGVFFDDILSNIKRKNKTLILIIDEYPIIHEAVELNKIDSQFISNLRGYMQNNSREFKMIYSGASSLKYLKSQYSSNIMGVGKSLEVSFLREDDVKLLISKPLKDQMQFEDSAFKYFMGLTNGHPFLVQVILSYLVDKLNREKKSSMVFKEAIEEGIHYFLEQAPHLQDDWNNRIYSNDLKWSEIDEKIAKIYKQLIITAVTDNWRKNKNGISKEEIYQILENGISAFHKVNASIFEEVLKILAGTDDILKKLNGLYFIKVGLFREWAIGRMNLTFNNMMADAKDSLVN
jgi:outer membrane protein assembly factor BamB